VQSKSCNWRHICSRPAPGPAQRSRPSCAPVCSSHGTRRLVSFSNSTCHGHGDPSLSVRHCRRLRRFKRQSPGPSPPRPRRRPSDTHAGPKFWHQAAAPASPAGPGTCAQVLSGVERTGPPGGGPGRVQRTKPVARAAARGGGRERGAHRATRTRSAETDESMSMIGPAGLATAGTS
jgi:hypothetical protein